MIRQSYRIPLAVAALIFAAMLAQHILYSIFAIGLTVSLQGEATDLAFAIGVFFSLWLLAEVTITSILSRVLLNSFIAAAAGAVLAGILTLVWGVIALFVEPYQATPGYVPQGIDTVLGRTWATLGNYLIFTTPLVMLAGVLLWLWLRRRVV